MTDLAATSLARLGGALSRVYEPNKVPDKPTYPYGELSVAAYLPLVYSLDGSTGAHEYQIVFRAFAKTEGGLTDYMTKALDLFLGAYLAADDGTYGPGRLELRPTIPIRDSDDNGVLGSIATFTFIKE